MLDPHREIQALVDNFVAELSVVAKRIAIEQVKLAFVVGAKLPAGAPAKPPGGAGARPAAAMGAKPSGDTGTRSSTRARGKPSRGAGRKPTGGGKLAAPAPAAPSAHRTRRGHDEIEALRGKLLTAIAGQPGSRTEELNAALGTTTTQIAPLLRRLVADKQARTEGARRGTRYFPVTAGDPQNGRRTTAAAATAASAASAASVAADAAPAADEPPPA